ncbi:hypothetical protein [Crassaminicella indica]|uniref:Uncharacterized protein n=1 Tax=Crassaminicella indica TaxID=2855394 RepID=A0ABX8RG03_9CLOT|nr:hypothetical protein [Crassaminicella indica]QXM05871.1 hypothetical protein KVH43_10975 [Crassaminicella indica]
MDMVLRIRCFEYCVIVVIIQNHLKGGMILRKRHRCIWRRIEKRFIGLMLLIIGMVIIAIKVLPVSVWIILLGVSMIYIGYKLFCSY